MNAIKSYNPTLFHITNNGVSLVSIYVINLRQNVHRRAYIKFIMEKAGLNYTLVIVDRPLQCPPNVSLGEYGCYLSHLWCLNDAIQHQYNSFLIFEDDIILCNNFTLKLKALLQEPLADSLLMLGACDFNLSSNIRGLVGDRYYPTHTVLGSHANLYTLEFAKVLLEFKLSHVESFDYNFKQFYGSHRIAVCYPNWVICELTTTSIKHNYSPLYPSRYKIYLQKCFNNQLNYTQYNMFYILFLKLLCDVGIERTDTVPSLCTKFNKLYRTTKYNLLIYCKFELDDLRTMVQYVKELKDI